MKAYVHTRDTCKSIWGLSYGLCLINHIHELRQHEHMNSILNRGPKPSHLKY